MHILPGQTEKISRPVHFQDLPRLPRLIEEMTELCQQPLGRKPYALALAHCQVDHDDPIRLFVLQDGTPISNPEILDSRYLYWHVEGCMSFPLKNDKKVRRAKEVLVKYISAEAREVTRWVDGIEACIFQHEIDHMNGISIYSQT